jgi:hypothetical protein
VLLLIVERPGEPDLVSSGSSAAVSDVAVRAGVPAARPEVTVHRCGTTFFASFLEVKPDHTSAGSQLRHDVSANM